MNPRQLLVRSLGLYRAWTRTVRRLRGVTDEETGRRLWAVSEQLLADGPA